MAAPAQVYDHQLIPVWGGAFDPLKSLCIVGPLDTPTVTIDPVWTGRVVHAHSSVAPTAGNLKSQQRPIRKLRPGAKGKQLPFFLYRGSEKQDAIAAPSDARTGGYQGTTPSGGLAGIAANNPVEIATTEFDITATYGIGDYLIGQRHDTTASIGGVLTNAGPTLGTTTFCGMAAAAWTPTTAELTDPNSIRVLLVHTVFIAGSEAAS